MYNVDQEMQKATNNDKEFLLGVGGCRNCNSGVLIQVVTEMSSNKEIENDGAYKSRRQRRSEVL